MNTQPAKEETWVFQLYVAGNSRKSVRANESLRRICDEYLGGRCAIEVIDLLERPELASHEQIIAIPTLIRRLPLPVRKVVGDLSCEDRVIAGLDLVHPCSTVRR